MISTELYEGQGLGNQLWVYVACRSIADHLGFPFAIFNSQRFKGSEFLEIEAGHGNELSAGGQRTSFREEMYYDRELDYVSSDFDARVLQLKPNSRIDGLFQSEEYLFDGTSALRRYIKIKDRYQKLNLVDKDCCVLYIRGGEYKRHRNLILPQSYWKNAIDNMKRLHGISKFLAITDDEPYVKTILPEIPLLPGTMAEDYVALHQTRFAIIANSSWGYFPLKTSDNNPVVIAPMYWSRFGNRYLRWASPANAYSDWMWQDDAGTLHALSTCMASLASTREQYQMYSVRTELEAVIKPGWSRYLSPRIRRDAKRVLSIFFPRHIG